MSCFSGFSHVGKMQYCIVSSSRVCLHVVYVFSCDSAVLLYHLKCCLDNSQKCNFTICRSQVAEKKLFYFLSAMSCVVDTLGTGQRSKYGHPLFDTAHPHQL